MVIFGIWHLALNWKSFLTYLKDKARGTFSREFLFSTLMTVLVFVGTIMEFQPFKAFIDLEKKIKDSWSAPKTLPPAPHTELFSLEKVSSILGISSRKALEVLKSKGISVNSPKETLKEIANRNNTSPAEIYEILKSASGQGKNVSTSFQPGMGIGRLTLKEACQKLGISYKECLKRLESKGIKAEKDATLRDIAFKYGMYPYQLLEIIQGGSNGQTK